MSSLCLYLPNVEKNYKYNSIEKIFNSYNFGRISYIRIIKTDYGYNRVFINYKVWFDNTKNNILKKNLNEGKSFKLFYNKYDFWNCYMSVSNKS